MINNVMLEGRLTKDPDNRMTQSGMAVSSFTLGVNRSFKKEGQPDADFPMCVAYGKTAEIIGNNLHKGSLIGVVGRLQTRSYDNQQGQRVYVTEVIVNEVSFLEPKKQTQGHEQPKLNNSVYTSDINTNMDDMPF